MTTLEKNLVRFLSQLRQCPTARKQNSVTGDGIVLFLKWCQTELQKNKKKQMSLPIANRHKVRLLKKSFRAFLQVVNNCKCACRCRNTIVFPMSLHLSALVSDNVCLCRPVWICNYKGETISHFFPLSFGSSQLIIEPAVLQIAI